MGFEKIEKCFKDYVICIKSMGVGTTEKDSRPIFHFLFMVDNLIPYKMLMFIVIYIYTSISTWFDFFLILVNI